MAKKVAQVRYYAETSENNYSVLGEKPNYRNLLSGSIFSQYAPIVQLGIQTLPGTKFYLNGSNNPIIVGNTGIYELNVQGMTEISSLQFDSTSLSLINSNNNAYLIVDMLYEGGAS